jgi:hypothetical protein
MLLIEWMSARRTNDASEGEFHVDGCACYSVEPLLKARGGNSHEHTQTSGYLTPLKEQTNVTELFQFQFESAVSVRFTIVITKHHVTIATRCFNSSYERVSSPLFQCIVSILRVLTV